MSNHRHSRPSGLISGHTGVPVVVPPPPAGVNFFNWNCDSNTTSIGSVLGYFGNTVLDSTVSHGGTKSMKMVVIGNDLGNQQMGADISQFTISSESTVGGPSIYYRAWIRYSSTFNWGSPQVANVKTARAFLNTGDYTTQRLMTLHMRSDGFYVAECEFVSGFGGSCLTTSGTPNNDYQIKIPYNVQGKADGVWHEYITRIKPNSTPTSMDAEFEVFVDGISIGHLYGWLLTNTDTAWVQAWGGWMSRPYWQMNDPTNVAGGTVWVDDISVDSGWNSLIPGSPF